MKKLLLLFILIPFLVLIPDELFAQKKNKAKQDPTWAMSKKSKKVNRKLSGKKKKKQKKVKKSSSLHFRQPNMVALTDEKRRVKRDN